MLNASQIQKLDKEYKECLLIFSRISSEEPELFITPQDVYQAVGSFELAKRFMRRFAGGKSRVKSKKLLPHLLSHIERDRHSKAEFGSKLRYQKL